MSLEPQDELTTAEQARIIAAVRAETMRRTAVDGWFWLTTLVKTRDEADQDSVKQFPRKPYLHELWNLIEGNQRVVIAKSRQLMLSWLLCAFAVWTARYQSNKLIIWQAQKKEDADSMVCLPGGDKDAGFTARMQFIVRSLPEWARGQWKEAEGELTCRDTQSTIKALPGGANQVRGKTPSVIIEDEFAYQDEQQGVYQAVAPLIQKATKLIVVSTPNGATNTFSTLFHGAPVGVSIPT